jgi:hypothetical protein
LELTLQSNDWLQLQVEKATTNREMMLDIQAKIDMTSKLCLMLLMAAGLDMCLFGKLARIRRLSRIVFACTYTLAAATMRRGEESYSQKSNSSTKL